MNLPNWFVRAPNKKFQTMLGGRRSPAVAKRQPGLELMNHVHPVPVTIIQIIIAIGMKSNWAVLIVLIWCRTRFQQKPLFPIICWREPGLSQCNFITATHG